MADRRRPTARELEDEERRLRRARHLVNFGSALITQSRMPRSEARAVAAAIRARVLELFPGQEETYEILYGRRFERLIEEFTVEDPPSPGRVLTFPRRS